MESAQQHTMSSQMILEKIKELTSTQLAVLWRFLEWESQRKQAKEKLTTYINNNQQVPSDLQALAYLKVDLKIRKDMGITENTVRSHITNICKQFGLYNQEGYRDSHREELYALTIAHIEKIKEILGLYSRRLYPVTKAGEPQKNFIIYRNLGVNHDWFDDFFYGLTSEPPQLGSELLYYGPGLARNWLDTSKSEYEVERRKRFRQCISKLLAKYLVEPTNLIDLGIGDFQMARIIVEYGLEKKTVSQLNYYPLDISYEMIASSLLNKRIDNSKVLSRVLDQGEIVAMNTPFAELYLYQNLFCKKCKNIYLFLGNTIGNEFDPVHTLQLIGKSMSEDDILMIEFQLIEDETFTDDALTNIVNNEPKLKKFYKGAFLALGCEDSKIDLSAFSSNGDYDSITYSFVCNFTARVSLKHPAFERPILVQKDSSISVYVVNKFNYQRVEDILDRAGFYILSQEISEFSDRRDRRFLYTVVQLKRS